MAAGGEVSKPTPTGTENSPSRDIFREQRRQECHMVLKEDLQENTSGGTPKKSVNSTPEDGGIHGCTRGFQIQGLTGH